MIVWVASYPRSGNRMSRSTLRQAYGIKLIGSAASDEALRRDLGDLLDELGAAPGEDPLPPLREYDKPVFLKTHSVPEQVHTLPEVKEQRPEEEERSPALYLVRDGRDCLVSYAHYMRRYNKRFAEKSFEEALYDLIWRPNPYGGWAGNVGGWRRRTAPVAFVHFEDMLEDSVAALGEGAAKLGLELGEPVREAPTFEQAQERSRKPELLRRGKAGSWRSEFPPDLMDEFWKHHGEEMERAGYERG